MTPVSNVYSLLVDLGNTRIKWTAFSGQIHSEMTADIYAPSLEALLDKRWKNIPQPFNIWIASVASLATSSELYLWIQKQWPDTSIHIVNSLAQYKTLSNAYQRPEALGVDRWLGLVAASEIYPNQAVCVISAGTCITFDVLDQQGKHLGGAILPGIHLLYHSLNRLELAIGLERKQKIPPSSFGVSTEECVNAGLSALLEGALSRLLEESFKKLMCSPLLILTGGDAGLLAPFLKQLEDSENNPYSVEEEPAWVLKGLSYLCRIARPRGV